MSAPGATGPNLTGPDPSGPVAIGLPGSAAEEILSRLASMQGAREVALAASRRATRSASGAIRAVHTRDATRWEVLFGQSEQAIREAQSALGPFPAIYFAGFLQDAEKEYGEAALTRALVEGGRLPTWDDLSIGLAPWLNGLCEAASELRRQVLDRLREGEPDRAESLLRSMDGVYEIVMGVDFPDALTLGLRRSADALRAVLERTRSDLTTTALQLRLQAALQGAAGSLASPAAEHQL